MGAPTGSATRVHNSPSSQALMWRATTRGLPVPSSPLATQPLTQKVKTWMGAACVQVYPRSTIHLQLSRRPQTLPPTAPVTTAITSRGAVKVPPAKPTSVQMPVSPSRFSPGWKNRGKTPNRKTLPLAQVHCSALLTIHFPNLWGNRATVQRGLFWRKDRGEGSSKDPGAGHDPKATSHTHRLGQAGLAHPAVLTKPLVSSEHNQGTSGKCSQAAVHSQCLAMQMQTPSDVHPWSI